MRILVLSDFIDNNINFPELLEKEAIRLIITLGDLNPRMMQFLKDTEIPKIGVYGNHDDGKYMEDLGIYNLHKKRVLVDGMSFSGYEGSVARGKGIAVEHSQEECWEDMAKMEAVDFFVSHAPAMGINDDPADPAHYGFEAFTQFLKEKTPQVYLHGHTYPPEDQYITRFKKTIVQYVQGLEVVDTNDLPRRSMLPEAGSYYSEVEFKEDDDIDVSWRDYKPE